MPAKVQQRPVGYDGEVQRGRRGSTIGQDESLKGSLYFAKVSFIWTRTESEKQTITDICCQQSERLIEREGKGSISTWLIRNSPSALHSPNKGSHTVALSTLTKIFYQATSTKQ